MNVLPCLGLIAALGSAPFLIALSRWLRSDSWAVGSRLAFWGAAIVVVVIARASGTAWYASLGLGPLTWPEFGLSAFGAACMMLGATTAQLLMRGKFGKPSSRQSRPAQGMQRLSFAYRCFIVVTAAVTEEVLYRGYAIGIGQHLLGGVWLASVVSVIIFTVAHYRWGLAQLPPVFICAVVVTMLFVLTQNLWVSMIAHGITDCVGFIAMPVAAARRQRQLASSSG